VELVSGTGAEGGNFVRHAGPNWVWFGPRSWRAAYGTYGITVFGPDRGIDLGFSTSLCAPGGTYQESVTNYFTQRRTALRQQGYTILGASAIVRPTGTPASYRRQTLQLRVRRGGVTVRGQFSFDYDFSATVDGINYCYERNLALTARQRQWDAARPVLVRVQRTFAYSGPGACTPTPTLDC
jgi:hypothetical protein